ncbi:pyridoxal phosphate-dependent aminotransferase [Streptomyces sp. NPDC021093]|uniref:pyridoxal phosphate-dependent aminotransferase n=1 Tax=Streptomyces sp. NPDC021093 TaxID=3365112 RepID=UPI0037A2B4C8
MAAGHTPRLRDSGSGGGSGPGPGGHQVTPQAGADRVHRLPVGGLAGLLRQGAAAGAVNLAVGTPSWPRTPPELVEQACRSLREGTNQYETPEGSPVLRERIAAALPGRPDPATELTVTAGGSEGLCVALLASVDPGDEVIVLEPFYENFLSAIAMAGGVPRFVPLRGPGWSLEPQDLIDAFSVRTRALVLNSPSNPTGSLLGRAELELVATLCQKWNTTVVSDEVYAGYVYDGARHLSVAEVPALADRSVVVGSLSKSHAVSGWRLGFLRAAPAWTDMLRRVHVATTGGAAAPLQHAAAAADLFGPARWDPAPEMQQRRDRAVSMLERAGFDCTVPQGGCYVMAGISGLTDEDSPDFARRLAAEAGVLVAPATSFFARAAGGLRHVRVAFNRESAELDAAQQRLETFARADRAPKSSVQPSERA